MNCMRERLRAATLRTRRSLGSREGQECSGHALLLHWGSEERRTVKYPIHPEMEAPETFREDLQQRMLWVDGAREMSDYSAQYINHF